MREVDSSSVIFLKCLYMLDYKGMRLENSAALKGALFEALFSLCKSVLFVCKSTLIVNQLRMLIFFMLISTTNY